MIQVKIIVCVTPANRVIYVGIGNIYPRIDFVILSLQGTLTVISPDLNSMRIGMSTSCLEQSIIGLSARVSSIDGEVTSSAKLGATELASLL